MATDLDPNNRALPSARATHEPSQQAVSAVPVGVPNALLPCPFCGGAPFVDRRSASTAVRCSNDQCIIGDPAPFNDFTHRTDAITAWNTRAALAPLAGDEQPDAYWSAESGNFYDRQTRKGMGQAFYREWFPKRDRFPTSPSSGKTE